MNILTDNSGRTPAFPLLKIVYFYIQRQKDSLFRNRKEFWQIEGRRESIKNA